MEPGTIAFGVAVFVLLGSYVCFAIGKRVGDEMATWVIANDDDDAPAPSFGIEDSRRRPALGRYRWYASQYRQLKRARSEPTTLANWFAAVQIAQVVGGLIIVVTWIWAFYSMDDPWR